MSIKLGDVDVAQEIIELRHQLIRTQMILELIVNKNMGTMQNPTAHEMKMLEDDAVDAILKRYPNSVTKKHK